MEKYCNIFAGFFSTIISVMVTFVLIDMYCLTTLDDETEK